MMALKQNRPLVRAIAGVGAAVLVAALGGCSMFNMFSSDKPKSPALPANPAKVSITQAWTSKIGPQVAGLQPRVDGTTVTLAGTDGSVAAIDAPSGRDLWRVTLKATLAAGPGTDGKLTAVASQAGDVIVLDGGRELWREKVSAQVYTPPLVAGNRVFVLAADRSVTAFDGATGRLLWRQQRPGEALVLKQAGVLLAVGDTLVTGQSGRLVGLNPNSGALRWEAPVATPRGINDIERLVDLVGRVARNGQTVCTRAFQTAVGCVDADRGGLIWSKSANGADGLDGDASLVFGTEADGKVVAWRAGDGERAWTSDALLYRGLSAPQIVGRSIAVGDNTGLVHILSREDGATVNRLSTDGSAIVAAPVRSGGTLVVVTSKGGVYGFRGD